MRDTGRENSIPEKPKTSLGLNNGKNAREPKKLTKTTNIPISTIDEAPTEDDILWMREHKFPKSNEMQVRESNENRLCPSFKEWSKTLFQKYHLLREISDDNFPGLWDSLEFELSIYKILNIKDCTLPFAGILLGPPGSLKTVGIELFRKSKDSFYTDNFSSKSFVSHSTAVKREQLAQIDLLPKIKNKFFLTPELSPTFAKKDEDLIETLGTITRILDGHGYENDTGAHGHRGYSGIHMFTWIGAAVDIPRKVHKYLGTLGPKLYFFRLPLVEKSDDEYLLQMNNDDFYIKFKKIQDTLNDYLEWFSYCPEIETVQKLVKITWDHMKDDKESEKIIIRIGKILAHLRAVVATWETDDTQGLDYAYTLAIREDPTRAMTQLRNLARGHALSQGRNYLTIEDMPLLIRVAFSTASLERVMVFELLIQHRGKLTTSQITASLNTTNNTAKRTMAELVAIGLVHLGDIDSSNGSREKQITLKDKFNWFLSYDFQSVRNLTLNHSCAKKDLVTIRRGEGKFSYTCYQCKKDGKIYETNSEDEYQNHWIKSGHRGTCYPGKADLERYGWKQQDREWEI
jgi:hypothetical protein